MGGVASGAAPFFLKHFSYKIYWIQSSDDCNLDHRSALTVQVTRHSCKIFNPGDEDQIIKRKHDESKV